MPRMKSISVKKGKKDEMGVVVHIPILEVNKKTGALDMGSFRAGFLSRSLTTTTSAR